MAPADPNIGRILDNRYELIELVGKGAMGRVYLARHAKLGGAVAVKFLSQALLGDKMRERFFTEAQTCAHLGQESIHIVRVSDFGVDEQDIPFYVMEYLQGESLSSLLSNEPLALPRFLGITRQTCLGLKAAHEGIVLNGKRCPIIHRDIKPSNILVTPDETMGELTKVLDFGIAKLIQEDASQTQGFMGTLAYSSPEQMEGQELTLRSDIYSLGIVMFQSLTGKLPVYTENHTFGGWYKAHHSMPPRQFSEVASHLKLPQSLSALIYGCLEKKPENRPANMSEILDGLKPLEQRFGVGRQIGHRIQATLARLPVVKSNPEDNQKNPPSIDEICLLQAWPKNKPTARIVFPQKLKTSQGPKPTLWVMLPKAEIQQLKVSRLYTQVYRNFLCTMAPHPMLMWLTALHNRFYHEDQEARWLTCFLDLKSKHGQSFAELLAEQGEYRVLFFALEEPRRCAHVLTTKINKAQCSLMKQWVITGRGWQGQGQPTLSKNMLRGELDRIKPQVQQNLDTLTGIDGNRVPSRGDGDDEEPQPASA